MGVDLAKLTKAGIRETHHTRSLFKVSLGTEHTILKGLLVWCVSLIPAFVNLARSTVRLGSPFFLRVITILVHHVSGTPGGTRSKIPLLTSASISLATYYCYHLLLLPPIIATTYYYY